ncbi:zinc-finger homeodomain protein 1-like [Salvia hispanica]|uniref:zinc-finger homeodomain protein 1-like n=1 Tax=Salvia hispanica TaxID=49212 RepID=UPI002009B701|nr:zinc-finger homeodomain protein 1-like [Salvia hispanica]
MDYEDQEEEQEGEVAYNNDSLLPKIPSPVHSPAAAPPPPLRKPRYKECLKNHAVAIGANAVDGCGEFLPAGDDGTLESLKCAACGCHRNFHRRESEAAAAGFGYGSQQPLLLAAHHHPLGHFGYRSGPGGYGPPHRAAPIALALPSSSGGGGPQSSREELEGYFSGPGSGARKRFRTKFTAEQKDRMLSLAERLDWKIQKQDEELVQQFCNEAGIKRHVLKVWMHNNKHTLGKKPS